MIYKYTIPLPPVTKKNSQRILVNRKTGMPFIAPSSAYKHYEEQAIYFLAPKPKTPLAGRIGKTRKISTATPLFGSAPPVRKDFFYMMVRQKKTIINIAHIAVQGW